MTLVLGTMDTRYNQSTHPFFFRPRQQIHLVNDSCFLWPWLVQLHPCVWLWAHMAVMFTWLPDGRNRSFSPLDYFMFQKSDSSLSESVVRQYWMDEIPQASGQDSSESGHFSIVDSWYYSELLCFLELAQHRGNVYLMSSVMPALNPFSPESNQCQNSPAASQEIWHHTVWRTWLFIAYSDEKWLYYKFSLHHSYNRFLKGWENTLFGLRSERVKRTR